MAFSFTVRGERKAELKAMGSSESPAIAYSKQMWEAIKDRNNRSATDEASRAQPKAEHKA